MVLLGPEPGRGGPSPTNAFSRPYATPDESLVRSFRRIQRQSPALKQLVRRPAAGAQQLEPLRRAGRPSPSLWPQQTGLASTTGLACQATRANADRAKQRRRRGGNHVCVCQICGQRTQQPVAASEQLGRLEFKWAEIRDHAVWKDAGFSGTTLQTLERQLDKIHRQMVVAHEGDASSPSASAQLDSKDASPQHPEPEPEPERQTGTAQDVTKLEDMTASRSSYLAANAPQCAAAAQVEEPRALVMGSLEPERLLAAAKAGNPDDIRELIEAGVDFNVASEAGGLAGIDRCLVLAAIRGHDAAVSVLLSAGADATVTQNGTSLLELVQKKHQEVARSPPGSPVQGTVAADGSIGSLSMAAHRDLLEGLQATEQILMKASELQQSNND